MPWAYRSIWQDAALLNMETSTALSPSCPPSLLSSPLRNQRSTPDDHSSTKFQTLHALSVWISQGAYLWNNSAWKMRWDKNGSARHTAGPADVTLALIVSSACSNWFLLEFRCIVLSSADSANTPFEKLLKLHVIIGLWSSILFFSRARKEREACPFRAQKVGAEHKNAGRWIQNFGQFPKIMSRWTVGHQ